MYKDWENQIDLKRDKETKTPEQRKIDIKKRMKKTKNKKGDTK